MLISYCAVCLMKCSFTYNAYQGCILETFSHNFRMMKEVAT